MYLLLSRLGVVSAVPVQLMSDHIFLGASVVAILSAELVLLRINLRSQSKPPAAQLLGLAGGICWLHTNSVIVGSMYQYRQLPCSLVFSGCFDELGSCLHLVEEE